MFLNKKYYHFKQKVLSFYQKRRYILLKTEVRLVEITKTILRLICGISAITLHQYNFLADGERSFGEGGREDLGEEVEEL